MSLHEERSVTTERTVDDGAVAADPVRRGNPAPVIAAICIGLLVLFLVLFGMSRDNGDDDGGGGNNRDDGVEVTVPKANDDGTGGANSDADADAGADADADAKTDTTTESP